ncbi:hypothetical protein E4U13_005964 [Claviceps humidiphila]|uniref:ABC transporter domain-containing protein n=1 Tax=Claviceps humidiphila TaxID=1294629 RepID=A0A9P7U214_9HYPO|nr:hypothetical protein E4U13_005964 [Claviceps humidiphila]
MVLGFRGRTAPELPVQETPTDGQQKTTSDALYPQHSRDSIEVPAPESTSSDSYDEPNTRRGTHAMIEDEDRSELVRIATALSRRGSNPTGQPSPGGQLGSIDENDPALNPENKDFDLEKWVRRFMDQMMAGGLEENSMGVSYRNLDVFGSGSALQLQDTVGSAVAAPLKLGEFFSFNKNLRKQILHSFDGFLNPGELLIVLGRPGSGCSTLLKTMCGELHGLELGEQSNIHYNGISQKNMIKEFKGEMIYNQEVDKHFPHLTVGQTLEFAASVRTPQRRAQDMSRSEYCQYIAKVVMAVFGLSHTYNTKVGNDFIRGVSGGERKRVSIAEMVVAGSPLTAWDNSTRGLDSATALKFVTSLRLASDLCQRANAVAIYQASQSIYDLFDKATVLYEGRQIYFGPADQAKRYFEEQGWFCPPRQTTGDFLTSVTNPQERRAREGFENKVPRTSEDFERLWRESPEYKALLQSIDAHDKEFSGPRQGESLTQFRQHKNVRQANNVRPKSPFFISYWMQVKLCTRRAYQRIWNDITATATQAISNVVMALIIGSIFFGTPDATVSFYGRGSVLFMAILMNALTSLSEITGLYDQRPIVEKHASYAFYHPSAEAAAGIMADIPVKFVTAVAFNVVLYFLSELRREPGPFFLYFLITYIATLVMSAVFRTMAAATKTVSQAMSISGVLVLALVIYTGFAIPVPEMHPWFSWIRWINPVFYAFEILVANEFHNRDFTCSDIVPPYSPNIGNSWVCNVAGAIPGQYTVSGDAFIATNYEYYYSHVWRNFGILIAFLVFFLGTYFATVELNSATSSVAEALVFRRGHVPAYLLKGESHAVQNDEAPDAAAKTTSDETATPSGGEKAKALAPHKDILTWRDVVYDIEIKGQPRRLLDHVSGWVKPGTLTALMGVSGAGKTTLLDALAQRTTMGVITGDMLVNGKPLDASFQRNTGYVQQQDLHLETATVRESLRFSAMLRQPKSVSKEEKYAFVEEVISMLKMEDFANAVVGVPGQGLNVEQRKLLTIGVELAAKPKLLLFLDEPTSGLDSQSSWAICAFLRKLADSGQAILCTIHQPSAILFQEFDRLLFLAKGGRTVYFGNIGRNSHTLLDYFERNGARKCDDEENPAEYMLEIVNRGQNDRNEDWHEVWKGSSERAAVMQEMDAIHAEKQHEAPAEDDSSPQQHTTYAMPVMSQLQIVTHRIFQQYWRMPAYIFAKLALGIFAGLFIGFTFFNAKSTKAGTQAVIFNTFMLTTIFSSVVQQMQPMFVTQRSLYEVRERPSKAYSWQVFMIANIVVEIPYQAFTAILIWAASYYPVIGIQSSDRQGLVLVFVIQLFVYASSFAIMCQAAMPDAHTAGSVVNVLAILSIVFSGVLQTAQALPGFWIFMYRVSPFTYWIGGIVGTELHERAIECSDVELNVFDPPQGTTCGEYLKPLLSKAPGLLQNPEATSQCHYCNVQNADQILSQSNIFWSDRFRNFGIMWAYILINIGFAVLLYYLFRVKQWKKGSSKSKSKSNSKTEGDHAEKKPS